MSHKWSAYMSCNFYSFSLVLSVDGTDDRSVLFSPCSKSHLLTFVVVFPSTVLDSNFFVVAMEQSSVIVTDWVQLLVIVIHFCS